MKILAKLQVTALCVAVMFIATTSNAQVVGSQSASVVAKATFCKVMDIQIDDDVVNFKVGSSSDVQASMNEWVNGVWTNDVSIAKVNATCDWKVHAKAAQQFWGASGPGQTNNLQTRYLEFKTNSMDANVTHVTHPSWRMVKPSTAANGTLAAKGNRGVNRMFRIKWALGRRADVASSLPSLLDRGVKPGMYALPVVFTLSEQ